MRSRVIAVMVILAAGFGMYAGIYSAIDSLFGFRDALYRRADVAAYEIRYSPEDAINVPAFDDVPGVRAAESRLLLPGNIERPDGTRLSALVVGVPEGSRINRLLLSEGSALDPAQPTRVVVDRNLARHHDVGLGDRVTVNVGKDRLSLDVGGVGSSAEFLVDGANPNFFLPARGSLGIVYVPLQLIEQRMGFRLVNSTVFVGESVATDLPAASMAEIDHRAGERLTLEDRLPLTRQFGHMFLAVDLNAFRIFTPAIVAIFAASAVTILFFLLNQWIAQQRQSLGVLSALGYGSARLRSRIIGPLVVMALGGLALGTGISALMLHGFGNEYATAIGLPPPELSLQPRHLLVGAVGMVLACLLGALGPLRQIARITPLAAVRDQPQTPAADHGRWAGRVADTAWRHALREVLRRRRASVMTVMAVALALAPALAYFVAIRSFEQAVVDSFERDRWDYSVDFLSPVWDDELHALARMPGVKSVDPFLRGAVRFETSAGSERGLLIGVLPQGSLRVPQVDAGRALVAGDRDAVVMERKLARDLRLSVGDAVTVDGRLGRHRATLVGTFSGALPGEVFTSREAARTWLDLEDQSTGVLVAAQPQHDLTEALYDDKRVGKVTGRQAMVDEVVAHLKEIAGIVYLAAAFSILVALLFLFTSTAFAFMAREGSFSLMEIIGFARRTVSSMVRREVALLSTAGVALGIPLGFALAAWLNGILGEAWFAIPTAWNVVDPLLVAAPALALMPLVARPVLKRIAAIDLPHVLRRRSFG